MLCPMFIRRTRTRTGDRGEVYYSHRLVRSERSGEKVRQRTLLNLGSDFPVERGHWAVLCARIQQLLDRQGELVPLSCPEEVERHAQRIAAQLLNSAPSGGTGGAELQTVDVGSLELIRPRSVGVEHVGLWAMERLGLEALLERLGFNGTQRALAMATVIARMAAPGSERASWRWLCERSALGELLGVDFERMSMMRLYRASDALMSHRAAIEAHLFDRATDLFGLRSTVTLYDLTNTFFEGAAAAQPKAERGHSKEKRSDCPLLTLGLVLDGSGFVRRSEVFSGAVNEDKTLASMLEALGAPADALVVMDAGIATEANIAWLRENGYRYLAVSRERKGISTGDFAEALAALLGPDAGGLSASTVARLTEVWADEHAHWLKRDLSARHYVYFWADGIHVQARLEDDAQCLLVIIGATPEGKKELVGLIDGVRESAQSWRELLLDLKRRGLAVAPELAIADGALGFWKAIEEVWPRTRSQRCWVHKTANVLNKLPKSQHSKAKRALQEIWMAETRNHADSAFDAFIETYAVKYDKAAACLVKDRETMLAFYDFPAEHWKHLRTTNPIESTFATVRHRTVRSKGCLSNKTALAMVFKLAQAAQNSWRRLDGHNQLPKLIVGVKFIDGIEAVRQQPQDAA